MSVCADGVRGTVHAGSRAQEPAPRPQSTAPGTAPTGQAGLLVVSTLPLAVGKLGAPASPVSQAPGHVSHSGQAKPSTEHRAQLCT